ncbi:hypothetical protein L596_013399 [Steinernema carpocapsae]|uniref:glucuronosyltransferase n=1 Tax=Steinernema carpocapsae TaxID=34508 RepID=A0A4U5P033_STECR|nr:hypothetical protein L596_013399 [Steinernema carpocapsae]
MPSLVFVLLLGTVVSGYKILVYSPRLAQSHVNFLGRIADILVEEGHDVTVVLPIIGRKAPKNGTQLAKRIIINQSPNCVVSPKNGKGHFDSVLWSEISFFGKIKMMDSVVDRHVCQCKKTIMENEIIDELKKENFDLGLSEAYDLCGMPFFHEIGVKKHVLVSSFMLLEWVAARFGAPNLPSLVPASFGELSNSMSYLERIQNIADLWMGDRFFEMMSAGIQDVANRKHGKKVMDVKEKLSEATFVITNSDPLIDFPRPISERILNIGGISVLPAKPLDAFWEEVMNRRRKTVLFSFGSVAESALMPAEVKKSVLETFSRFPDTTFIWKYENESHNAAAGHANVVTSKWVPQNDLLNHPRMSLFITHSGLASTLETSARGVPMLCIPLFADQMRNAKMVDKMGSSKAVDKKVLFDPELFAAHIWDLLNNDSYQKHAQRLAEMIKDRPKNQRQSLLKYIEFAARFGSLMEKKIPELGFVQYYLLDIIIPAMLILLSTIVACFFVVFKMAKLLLSFAGKTPKAKTA